LTWRPTWKTDQPAYLPSARPPGGPVRPILLTRAHALGGRIRKNGDSLTIERGDAPFDRNKQLRARLKEQVGVENVVELEMWPALYVAVIVADVHRDARDVHQTRVLAFLFGARAEVVRSAVGIRVVQKYPLRYAICNERRSHDCVERS